MPKELTIVSDLMCLDCGSVFPIRRKTLHQKKEGHIKDLYCPTCKTETKHFELKDKDKFLWKYSHLTDEDILSSKKDETTKQAILLLRKRELESEKSRSRVLKKIPSQG